MAGSGQGVTVVSGHQPVYLPWLGLLHKAALADRFVFMDDVQYLRQDWNNRNKIRTPAGWQWLTVPVALKASASDALCDVRLATDGWGGKHHWQLQHYKSFRSNYSRAPYWRDHADWLESFYRAQPWEFLAEMNRVMLEYLLEAFGIRTEIVIASARGFEGRKSDLVLDHARKLGADILVTGALGRDYIVVDDFSRHGVFLWFQRFEHPVYRQSWDGFEPGMCGFDLLFNHGPASGAILRTGNVTRDALIAAATAKRHPTLLENVG